MVKDRSHQFEKINLNIKLIMKIALISVFICLIFRNLQCEKTTINSRIKTQQRHYSVNNANDQIYFIDVNRINSSNQEQGNRCRSVPRSINVSTKNQIFRLPKGDLAFNRKQKIYEKITTLSEQQNIIQQFQIVGNKIFAITTDGTGYFIEHASTQLPHKMVTGYFDQKQLKPDDFIVIRDYKERALIISKDKTVLCRIENDACDNVSDYQAVSNFRGAEVFEDKGKFYLFIIAAEQIISYELTANGKLKNKNIYGKQFFSATAISFRGLYHAYDNTIFVLDDLGGVRKMVGNEGFSNFIADKNLIYQQFGCYQIVGQDKGESIVLACAPSLNSYFLLKLIKLKQDNEIIYEPQETVFLHQKLYQIGYVENILLSQVFTGVKLYWTSKQLNHPYPYFYRQAGTIFFHNVIKTKMTAINGAKTIFLAAEDQLFKFQLVSIEPYVTCFSNKQVNQQYSVKYYVPCNESSSSRQQKTVCEREEYLNLQIWQHKQVKIATLLIPFLFSVLGVIIVAFAIYKIYKRYNKDVQNARIKYNITQNQLD